MSVRGWLPVALLAMKIDRQTTRDELIWVWLRSEWDGVEPPKPPDTTLIDSPDFTDQVQNQAREELLYRHREPILNGLPSNFDPLWADIEETDLANLHILPSLEWYLDTGGTFRLVDTDANLAHGRELRLGQIHYPFDHLTKIEDFTPRLVDYDAATTRQILILIAADQAGPYVIIDGTHRAAALYRNYLTKPNMPWKVLLIVDRTIADSTWYIESQIAKQGIIQFKRYSALGALR